MATSSKSIVKRDGKKEVFSPSKIKNALEKAFLASPTNNQVDAAEEITINVINQINSDVISVEEVQDIVEKELMKQYPDVAKKYILYRDWRTTERQRKTKMKHIMDGIVAIDKNDINLSNANMSSHTPAGQMMTFASEVTKDYTYKYLLPKNFSEAHLFGDIHIHDLDYYPTKTTTCIQYDLEDLFERGFRTKNGSIRTPQSIQSYATLATIIFQTNQNEQHGGQAIPAFDFFMAKGVLKSFIKHVTSFIGFFTAIEDGVATSTDKAVKEMVKQHIISIEPSEASKTALLDDLINLEIKLTVAQLEHIIRKAFKQTRKDTHQAMEGFIHNLNTMHSRGGNQVVFSSINYGTDTSAEGRMVMEELMLSTIEGLGTKGEVPVFPIQIFKVKDGVTYTDEDYQKAMANFDDAISGKIQFKAPNFDLYLKACRTTAKALFPNFMFLDTKFNKNDKWNINDPNRYHYELATMGCRTRVYEDLHGEKSSLGRGNLSFTTMNMPRLAIEAMKYAKSKATEPIDIHKIAKSKFLESVKEKSLLIGEQLYARYQYQRTALARQFPFMMANDVWKGGGALDPNTEVGDVLKHGTLGIGFIGGHNAMVALYGSGHGHNKEAWNTLYQAVETINEAVEELKDKYQLNYSVLATPAEGLSGRFTQIDRKKYGIIPGVTDKDYYINSFHVDVKEAISIVDKIKAEAPFHAITKGGHITYVELDGEAQKNVKAIAKIVKVMHDEQIGYGSINHPIDTCKKCGYRGMIYDKCPICRSEAILRMRRITGYLTGDLSSWNSAKQAEEHDRIKHH